MRIKYLAHSSFLITAQDGTTIVTDPYRPGCFNGAVGYQPITEKVDIAVISHDHEDHNYVADLEGNPRVVKEAGEHKIKNIEFFGIATFHDKSRGSERGKNTIFVFEVDKVRICHLGDLGHSLNSQQVDEISAIDVLLTPIGGYFTIDAKEAAKIIDQLMPQITIPMHYKTESLNFPISSLDEFLKGKSNVVRKNCSEVEIVADKLPASEIWVLQHSK